jgi:hypothetical protein
LHDADQGAVAQADEGRGVDSVEEPGLVGGEDTLLLRFMPAGKAVPSFDRQWLALVLTAQLFVGAFLGVAAQVLLFVVVIFHIMPWFGLGLLDMARDLAEFDLSGRVLSAFWLTRDAQWEGHMNRRTTSVVACVMITASPAFAADVTSDRLVNAAVRLIWESPESHSLGGLV